MEQSVTLTDRLATETGPVLCRDIPLTVTSEPTDFAGIAGRVIDLSEVVLYLYQPVAASPEGGTPKTKEIYGSASN
jgi:hypothetical protein